MYLEPSKSTQNPGNEMALVITIGPSKEPAPLMRYEFHSLASKSMTNEQTNHELIMRSKSIQSKFSDLIFGICSLLQSSYAADIEKLRMWLSYQSCSQSAQSLQAFDSDSDALKAKSIPALILSLKCYTSWYNYGLIADIAKKFCGDKGSALVEAYEDELQLYLKTLIIHCPPLFPDHDNSTKALSCFEVDVEWNPSTSFLEDIAIFKSTLCKLCNLDPRFLVITTINATDFRMSWAIPKAAAGIINEVKTQSQHEGVKFIKLPGDLKTVSCCLFK